MRLFAGTLLPCLLISCPPIAHTQAQASANDQTPPAFNLRVAIDEVPLTFHAADGHGLPVNDLTQDEVTIVDNEKLSGKIISFELLKDSPIRAGILMDTSASMRTALPANRSISIHYAQSLLRQSTDQAFVVKFGRLWNMEQAWTNDPAALTEGIQHVATGSESRLAGTAIFDNLAHTCRIQFAFSSPIVSGNFILLFSDGEDNASSQSLKEAVDACQHANVAIYAFSPELEVASTGPANLAKLTQQTGGRVFHSSQLPTEISEDLHVIEADMRNQYKLIYRPSALKHDGTFHSIVLLVPDRVFTTNVRSGYYAPVH